MSFFVFFSTPRNFYPFCMNLFIFLICFDKVIPWIKSLRADSNRWRCFYVDIFWSLQNQKNIRNVPTRKHFTSSSLDFAQRSALGEEILTTCAHIPKNVICARLHYVFGVYPQTVKSIHQLPLTLSSVTYLQT